MADLAVRVENLGKRYQIAAVQQAYRTLRDALTDLALAPRRFLPEARHRTQQRKIFWALQDVTFDVRQGEVIGIIGRNGAGKSTLLKLLSEVTEPTSGRIVMHGRVSSLLEVGTGFHPELSGRENVFLNGAILGMSKKEIARKFDDIVGFAGVEQFVDTQIKHYSSGMYLRLAFSVAAHLEPEILIIDEVLAVGDAEFQRRCLGKMREVSRSGRTVLFVSHDLGAVARICSRCLVLDRGRLIHDCPAGEAIEQYLAGTGAQASSVALVADKENEHHELFLSLDIRFLNGLDGSAMLPWDEPIQLEVHFRLARELLDLSIGICLQTSTGMDVFTVRSTGDLPLRYRPGVSYTVLASIDHRLRKGSYVVLLGLYSGNQNYYFNPRAATVEIADISRTGSDYQQLNYGIIDAPVRWHLSSREALV